MRSLDYIFASNKRAISLSPLDSDSVVNLAHMEQLVGTLIKQGASGRYEPYLAEQWQHDASRTAWSFKFRSGLKCENGESITPSGFKSSFEKNLRSYYRKRPQIPVFESLTGFNEFVASASPLRGLEVTAETLTFRFDRPIKTGLLEFLAMPYFGYYCDANFSDGDWKSPDHIISSGPYQLVSIENDKFTIHLQKRPDWFSVTPESPETVSIRQMPLSEALEFSSNSRIIFTYTDKELTHAHGMTVVRSVPEILIAIVLSPYIENVFHRRENRATFRNRFRLAQQIVEFDSSEDVLSESFYPSWQSQSPAEISRLRFKDTDGRSLKVIMSDHLNETHQAYFRKIFETLFDDVSVEYQMEMTDRTDPNWLRKQSSNRHYDIRIVGVSIGGGFQNWLTEMMFCSDLGIGFPDPSGGICALVKSFDSSQMEIAEYAKAFNALLYEDASVLPVFHRRYSWLVDPGIDSKLSPVSAAPRFDLIRSGPQRK